MKKAMGAFGIFLLAAVLALPVWGLADTETIGGVTYTYAVSGGAATITGASYEAGAEIVIPDALGGAPVTAIGAGAFETVAGSITLPAGLLELRGDEIEYGDEENGLQEIEIPGRFTVVYPAAIRALPDGARVYSYKGSMAVRWAARYDKWIEGYLEGEIGSVYADVDPNMKRGWDIGYSEETESERFYSPTTEGGFGVTLSGGSGSGEWFYFDFTRPQQAPQAVTVDEDGHATLMLPVTEPVSAEAYGRDDLEAIPQYELVFFYKDAEGNCTGLAVCDDGGDWFQGWMVEVQERSDLANPEVGEIGEVAQGDAFTVSISPVTGAAEYRVWIDHEGSDGEPAFSLGGEDGFAAVLNGDQYEASFTTDETWPSGEYSVSVRVNPESESDSWSKGSASFTVTLPPLTTPEDLAVRFYTQNGDETDQFVIDTYAALVAEVTPVENASGYEVKLFDKDETAVYTEAFSISEMDEQGSGIAQKDGKIQMTLAPDAWTRGQYTVAVTAKGDGETRSDSAAAQSAAFALYEKLPTPVLTEGLSAQKGKMVDYTSLPWNSVMDRYAFEVYKSGESGALLTRYVTGTDEDETVAISISTSGDTFAAGNTYEVYVTARAAEGNGDYYVDSQTASTTFAVTALPKLEKPAISELVNRYGEDIVLKIELPDGANTCYCTSEDDWDTPYYDNTEYNCWVLIYDFAYGQPDPGSQLTVSVYAAAEEPEVGQEYENSDPVTYTVTVKELGTLSELTIETQEIYPYAEDIVLTFQAQEGAEAYALTDSEGWELTNEENTFTLAYSFEANKPEPETELTVRVKAAPMAGYLPLEGVTSVTTVKYGAKEEDDPNTETIGGVTYTYAVSGGAATITGASYEAGAEIVIPDALGGAPVTAIGAGAFETVAGSITLPAGLLELRGDEIGYSLWTEDDEEEPTAWLEELVIPGKATLVYPRAIEDMEDGAAVAAYEDSLAAIWAGNSDKEFRSFEENPEYGVGGSLAEAGVTVSSEVLRGWDLNISGSIAEDYFYPTKAQGFPVTLSGTGAWYAWDLQAWRNAEDEEGDAGLITLGAVSAYTFPFGSDEPTVDPADLVDLGDLPVDPHHEYIFFCQNAEGAYSKVAYWEGKAGEGSMGYPVMIRRAALPTPVLTPAASLVSQGRRMEIAVSRDANAAGYGVFVTDASGVEIAFEPALTVEEGMLSIPTGALGAGAEYTARVRALAVEESGDLDSEEAAVTFAVTAKPKLAAPALSPKTQSVVTGGEAIVAIAADESAEEQPASYAAALTDAEGAEAAPAPGVYTDGEGHTTVTVETGALTSGAVYTLRVKALAAAGGLYADSAEAEAKITVIPKTRLASPALSLSPKRVEHGGEADTIAVTFPQAANADSFLLEVADGNGDPVTASVSQTADEESGTVIFTVNGVNAWAVGTYTVSVTAKAAAGGAYLDSEAAAASFTVTAKVEDEAGNTYATADATESEKKNVTLTQLGEGAASGEDPAAVTIAPTFRKTETVDGAEKTTEYTVTEIGAGLLENNSGIARVTLPETITAIGENAFAGSAVETINLEDTKTETIGDGAFKNAASLTSVTLPETTTAIGASAFEGTAVTGMDLSGTSVCQIGDGAFKDAASLTEVKLSEETVTIGAGAFENAGAGGSGMEEIVLPAKVETIGDGAFSGTRVKSVTVASAELAVTSAAAFLGIGDDTTVNAPAGSLAEYFYNSYQEARGSDQTAVTAEDCPTLPEAVQASLNTVDGQITQDDEVILTVENVDAAADYVVIVEVGGDRIVIERRGGVTVTTRLEGRAAGRRRLSRGTEEKPGLNISLGSLQAGSYTLRYTVNEKAGGGWTQLAARRLTVKEEAETQETVESGALLYQKSGAGLTVTGPAAGASQTAFVIPETVDAGNGALLPVTAIAAGAFTESGLSISIPKTVITIGENAIPQGAKVTAPRYSPAWFYAAANAWSLTEDEGAKVAALILPTGLKTLSASALSGTAAECVILPEGCDVQAGALAGCGNLKAVAFTGTSGTLLSPFGDEDGALVLLVNADTAAYPNVLKDVIWAE